MRILMLTQFYPPIIGGEERHTRNLSIELVKRGHEVAVATIAQGNLPEYEVDQGVRVYRLHPSTRRMQWLYSTHVIHAPPVPDPELVLGLRRIVRQERPQIVHAHNWLVYSFLPLKSWSGVKLILTLHDHSLACVQKRRMYLDTSPCESYSLNKCLNCAANHYGAAKGALIVGANRIVGAIERQTVDMFLPVSQAVVIGNRLQSSQLPFRVIPNFVPDDIAVSHNDAEVEAHLSHLPSEDFLLYVGQLARDKGVGILLCTYAKLRGAIDCPPLVLIGGDDAPDTASIMQNLPAGVVALKALPHAAVMEALRRSTVALVPSLCSDACPTVVMEAMAVGRPVVGSRAGGIPDLVVDNATGLIVPPGDTQALQQAIERLLSAPDLRARMGQAAKERGLAYQAHAVVPRIEHVYEEVLQGKTG